jgi:ABC-2 type transport system permease protein
MNTVYPTLVRRELWEHRALWLTPVVVTGLIVLVGILAAISGGIDFGLDFALPSGEEDQQRMFASTVWAVTTPHYLIIMIVLFFYLLDCLFSERRDRSILFWKSMPVSDTATVLSKLLVAAVLVPLGVYALALVNGLLVSVIWAVHIGAEQAGALWDTATWFRVQAFALVALIFSVLWYLPVIAYLLLLSAWTKRNVFLWAVLPPVVIMLIEWFALDTNYAMTFLGYRLGGVMDQMSPSANNPNGFPDLFRDFSVMPFLTNVDLWLGLVVAAGLVYAAIYVRRYRDDT